MPKERETLTPFPFFITFEGGEGSGKSTQAKLLAEYLTSNGYEVVLTRELDGDNLCRKLGEIVTHEEMHPLTELFLFEAIRAQHMAKVIIPALKDNKIVICDRFTDTTIAYQSDDGAGIVKSGIVRSMNQAATFFPDFGYNTQIAPDLTFWLDVEPEVGLNRQPNKNKFEAKDAEYHRRVWRGFYTQRRAAIFRMCTIDASKPIDNAQNIIREVSNLELARTERRIASDTRRD